MKTSLLGLSIAGVLFLVMLIVVWWWGFVEGRASWKERAELAESELDATIVSGKKREAHLFLLEKILSDARSAGNRGVWCDVMAILLSGEEKVE